MSLCQCPLLSTVLELLDSCRDNVFFFFGLRGPECFFFNFLAIDRSYYPDAILMATHGTVDVEMNAIGFVSFALFLMEDSSAEKGVKSARLEATRTHDYTAIK